MPVEGGPHYPDIPKSPITDRPHLQLIRKVHELANPVEQPDGSERHWWEVSQDVKPFKSGLELSENIREAVFHFVGSNIENFQEKTTSKFGEFTQKQLMEALVHNWVTNLGDDLEGQRREVLLSVASHVVSRIESKAYRDILQKATEEDLVHLGITPAQRNLTVELLDIAPKMDPLFTRFMAFGYLSNQPPEKATTEKMFVPHDQTKGAFSGKEKSNTFTELFPKESHAVARRFAALARTAERDQELLAQLEEEKEALAGQELADEQLKNQAAIDSKSKEIKDLNKDWQQEPGGELFRQYLQELANFYSETNPQAMKQRQKRIMGLYEDLLNSGYPVILTNTSEGYYKEPYYDPEIRISLITPDAQGEIEKYDKAKAAMADSLSELGLQRFAKRLRDKKNISAISIGAHGVNSVFIAVAQEDPQLTLYLNEQRRSYDKDFYKFVKLIRNAEEVFEGDIPLEENQQIQFLCRMNTMFHENSHVPFPAKTKEQKRFGDGKAGTIVDEVKADILYRPLIPSIIEKGGLEGTKEQWAVGMIASAMQSLADEGEDSEYFLNACYSLNDAFEQGVIVQDGDRFTVTDFDAYYQTVKNAAVELISLYENPEMNEEKANAWIKRRCKPNEHLQRAIAMVKKENEVTERSSNTQLTSL